MSLCTQVKIVLEWCDCGSLRDALLQGAFQTPSSTVNYPAVLETAIDIASGMMHLHASSILHSDLKVRGVSGLV